MSSRSMAIPLAHWSTLSTVYSRVEKVELPGLVSWTTAKTDATTVVLDEATGATDVRKTDIGRIRVAASKWRIAFSLSTYMRYRMANIADRLALPQKLNWRQNDIRTIKEIIGFIYYSGRTTTTTE